MLEKANKFITLKIKDIITYIPVIIFGIAMLSVCKIFFGNESTVAAVPFLLFSKELYKTAFSLENYCKNLIIILSILLLGTFASMSFITSLIINFLFIFFILFTLNDDFISDKHFVYGISFFIVQLCGGAFEVIPQRLITYVCCAMATGIFLYLSFRFSKEKNRDNSYVKRSCSIIARQMNLLLNNKSNISDGDILNTAIAYCKEEYKKDALQENLMNEREKFNLMALMSMEQFSELIYDTHNQCRNFTQSDIEYFAILQKIFSQSKNLKRLAMEINDFVEKNQLSNPHINEMWKKQLMNISANLNIKTTVKPVIKCPLKTSLSIKLKLLKMRLNLNMKSYSFRVALQSTVILTIAAAAGYIFQNVFNIDFGFLLPLMTYTTYTIYNRSEIKMLGIKSLCALLTMILFTLAMYSLSGEARLILCIIIGVIMLCCLNSKLGILVFAFELTVTSAAPAVTIEPALILRIIFIIAGFAICVILTKFVLRTQNWQRFTYMINDIMSYNVISLEILENANLFDKEHNMIYELLLNQHLLVDKINTCDEDRFQFNRQLYSKIFSYNCDLLTDLTYALTIIKPNKLSENWIIHTKEKLKKITS